jgi:hypothetical protein
MEQKPVKQNQQGVTFEGGSGNSVKEAIIIKGAPSHRHGVEAEYIFMHHKYGRRDVDWKVKMQMLLKEPPAMDLVQIELADGTINNIYFDLSDCWGKK